MGFKIKNILVVFFAMFVGLYSIKLILQFVDQTTDFQFFAEAKDTVFIALVISILMTSGISNIFFQKRKGVNSQ